MSPAADQKLTDILNYGALNLAISIGYRTRLFDALDELEGPAGLDAIAAAAQLDSRYIAEWLAIMVCGGIIELSEDESGEPLYHLPEAFAARLTRRSGNANLGVYTQEIPLLTTCAWDAVVDRFHTGQGVAYAHYPRFQAFMSQLADAKHREVLVGQFLPSIDNGAVVRRLERGIGVCDLGCAEGVALGLMAAAFPESHFTGMDIDAGAIETAARKARALNLANAEFIQVDAAALAGHPQFGARFDYVTAFDSIHDQTQPQQALAGVYHMLRPGGYFSMVDIAARSRLADNLAHPMGAFLYTVSLMHCMPVGKVNNGMGLGMMWGRETACRMLAAAGFAPVKVLEIPHDSFNDHFYCQKPI